MPMFLKIDSFDYPGFQVFNILILAELIANTWFCGSDFQDVLDPGAKPKSWFFCDI